MKKKSIINIIGSLSLAFMLTMSPAAAFSNVYAAPSQTESQDKATEETKTEETKAEETRAEEKKTEETKAEETKVEETKVEETKAEETKTEETKAEEAKTEETKTDETKAEETKTEETAISEGEAKETSGENTEEAAETKTEAVTEEKAAEQPELTAEEQAEKEAEDARKNLQNDPNHVHQFKWVARMGESESADGTMNYICEECGKIWFFRPVSAYVAFEGDVAHRIEKAAEGETINIKTSHFINFNAQVLKALASRPDVSVHVSFLDQAYKGNRVSFTIPAGEDALSLLDENGYAGFRFLGNKYGLTMEEPMVVDTPEEAQEAQKEVQDKVQEEKSAKTE